MRCLRGMIVLVVACIGLRAGAVQSDLPGALFAANRFAQARTEYARAITDDPQRAESHIGFVRTLMRLDEWKDALRAAKAASARFPGNAELHGLLSLCFMRAGLPDRAAGEAQQGIEIDPNSYWALVAHGKMQLWGQRLIEARTTLHKATALHPDWPEAWKLLVDASGDAVTEANLADTVAYTGLAPKGHPHDLALEALPARIKFIRGFLQDQPYHAVAPVAEDVLIAADQGREPVFTFTTGLDRQGNYVILPIQIDDEKFKVLFDTGGGFELTLDRKAADRLKLPVLFRSIVRGVSGKENSALYKAAHLRVGDQQFQAVPIEAIANDVGPFDGIFGVTNFDHYAVTIDFEHNKLVLARGKGATAPPAAMGNHLLTVPFHYSGGDLFVRLTVEGHQTWAIVDTGADAYAILSLALAREIAATRPKGSYRELTVAGRIGIGTTENQQRVLTFNSPVGIQIGGTGEPPFRGTINQAYGASPLDTQVSPASDFEIGAILGIDFLASARRMTIDYPHHILTMEFAGESPAGAEAQ